MEPVNIAQLKSQLSRYLRQAQKGHDVVITDRGRPVARLVAYRETSPITLEIRKPTKPLSKALVLPPAKGLKRDVVELLREERGAR